MIYQLSYMIYDVLGRPQVCWWSSLMFDDGNRPGRYQYIIYDLLHPADWLGVADQRVGDVIRRYMIYEKFIDGDLWPHGRLRRRLIRIRIWYTGYLTGPELLGDDGELELKRAMFWYIIYGFHRLHKLWALWISTIFEKNFMVLFLLARVGAPVGLAEARPTRSALGWSSYMIYEVRGSTMTSHRVEQELRRDGEDIYDIRRFPHGPRRHSNSTWTFPRDPGTYSYIIYSLLTPEELLKRVWPSLKLIDK